MQETYMFGYGSLMFPEGTNGRNMVHNYCAEEFVIARLLNFERGAYLDWSGRRYYSLKEKENAYVLGTVIKIDSEEDLDNLLKSERAVRYSPNSLVAYEVVDVTKLMLKFVVPAGARVLTLIHPKELKAKDGELYTWYQQFVWEHIQEYYGDDFVKEFLTTGGRK